METLFTNQYRDARTRGAAVLRTPQFGEMQLGRDEANNVSWEEFSTRLEPVVKIPAKTGTEFILIPKRIIWSHDDINLFAGNPMRPINEFDQFTRDEGDQLFGIYQTLVDGVLDIKPTVHVSTGFNPTDTTAGHHSVLRFHSHIYVPSTEMREEVAFSDLDKFYQLAFFEPFSPVLNDLVDYHVRTKDMSVLSDPVSGVGFTSLKFDKCNLKNSFDDVIGLYGSLKSAYRDIASIYTNGESDPETLKYIPVDKAERRKRYDAFMKSTTIDFQPESQRVLEYLVDELQTAEPRNEPRKINNRRQMHLTRGFAGSITFRFFADSDEAFMDIAPRVITTSSVAKTLYGENEPTEIIKGAGEATKEQVQRIKDYERHVVNLFTK